MYSTKTCWTSCQLLCRESCSRCFGKGRCDGARRPFDRGLCPASLICHGKSQGLSAMSSNVSTYVQRIQNEIVQKSVVVTRRSLSSTLKRDEFREFQDEHQETQDARSCNKMVSLTCCMGVSRHLLTWTPVLSLDAITRTTSLGLGCIPPRVQSRRHSPSWPSFHPGSSLRLPPHGKTPLTVEGHSRGSQTDHVP